jgi:hypothetical protein
VDWIDYMLKDRQKSEFDGFLDCIIIESLHNPIADARRSFGIVLCQCCGISDLLSMTPYLALARSAPAPSLRAGEANVSIDRLSSIVGPERESANNNPR